MLHHRGGAPVDHQRYRRKAGLACAAVCVVALALFFELTARMSGTSFVGGPAYDSGDEAFVSMIIVAGPSLLATGALWWAARKVAGQYARETAAGSPLEEG